MAVHYALPPAGEALLPALQALTTWAAENLPPECGARPAGARVRAAAEPVRR